MKLKIFVVIVILLTINTQNSNNFEDPPTEFSWDNINGQTYLGTARNQNFPFACNSGWAFSTISMLESRIKKRRNGQSPDISLSTQVLLSCDTLDYGCLGGQPLNALKWIKRNNITDQSCHSYLARGYTEGEKCISETKCQKCSTTGNCKSQQNSKIYGIQDYGLVGTESDMMKQIQEYGPIVCGISVTNQLKNYTKGIFEDKTGAKGPNHFVLIYGWGENNGTKFWYGKNSWGSSWGQNGNFRVKKGVNNLGLESLCYWSSPFDSWSQDIRNKTLPSFNLNQQVSISRIDYQLPKYLTHSRSVLTPRFCEASWAVSIISMLRDRLARSSKGKINVDFSIQSLLNCGLGNCQKQTDIFDALSYIHKYGIPEESCQNYQGEHPAKQNCSGINNCAACSGTAFRSNCSAVPTFKRWTISSYNVISGQANMKSQITNNGPIVCGIDKNATKFANYEGGIIEQISLSPKVNHYVEVVGFGTGTKDKQAGMNYWIVRNVWGTSWGEEGFFRILRASNNLGIQRRCVAAVVANS